MSSVGAQQNETFRGWYEMQRMDTTVVKIIGFKTICQFDKVGNIKSSSCIEHNSGIQKYP